MHTFARLFSAVLSPLAAMALVLAVTGPVGAQAQPSSSSPWAMGNHDIRHTNQSSQLGPLFPSGAPLASDVTKWQGFDKLKTSFALSPDNQTIYAGLGFDFCAIRISDMTKLWCVRLDADVSMSTPSVDQQGNVYLGDRDNSVTKFNTDPSLVCPPLDTKLKCRKIWQYNDGREGDVWTDPVIHNGWIYFANNQSHDGAGVVTAVDAATGEWKWKYVLGNFAHTSSPAFDSKGIMYIGDKAGYLHAFKEIPSQTCQALPCPNVVRLWKQQIGISITASPVISADSKTLFVGSTNGLSAIDICDNVDVGGLSPGCVNPHGTKLWTFPTNGAIGNTPALASNGTLYFGAKIGSIKTLYALDPAVSHTAERWKYQINSGSEFSAFPIVGADGTVYAGLDRGVYAFRPCPSPPSAPCSTGGQVLWSYQTTNFIISSPIIGGSATPTGGQAQAILFIGSTDQKLYAISSTREGNGTGEENHPPTVNAGANPTNAVAGQTVVSFNGTGNDLDNDTLSYSWDFGDGTAATPFGPNPNTTHTYASANPNGTPKTYVATLTVDDGQDTGTDQVQVIVSAPGGGGTPGSFSDGFDRADSDVLGGPSGGPQWAEAKGNLEIKSGRLQFKVGPGTIKGDNIAVLPALTGPNQAAEAEFTSVDNNWGPRLGVVLGHQGPLNYYLLYRTTGSTVAVRISKVVNGVETVLASKAVPPPTVNTPFHLKGTMSSNNTLTLTLGPSQAPIATLSVTNSVFSGGTLGILIGANFVLPYAADDFVATATP